MAALWDGIATLFLAIGEWRMVRGSGALVLALYMAHKRKKYVLGVINIFCVGWFGVAEQAFRDSLPHKSHSFMFRQPMSTSKMSFGHVSEWF